MTDVRSGRVGWILRSPSRTLLWASLGNWRVCYHWLPPALAAVFLIYRVPAEVFHVFEDVYDDDELLNLLD
jgi:hypothetical protein